MSSVMIKAAVHNAAGRVNLAGGGLPPISIDNSAPGASAFQTIVGVLMFYGLLAGLAGLLISALVFALGRWFGNHHATTGGRIGMLSGMACAIVVGGGSALINWAFALGASVAAS